MENSRERELEPTEKYETRQRTTRSEFIISRWEQRVDNEFRLPFTSSDTLYAGLHQTLQQQQWEREKRMSMKNCMIAKFFFLQYLVVLCAGACKMTETGKFIWISKWNDNQGNLTRFYLIFLIRMKICERKRKWGWMLNFQIENGNGLSLLAFYLSELCMEFEIQSKFKIGRPRESHVILQRWSKKNLKERLFV